MRVLTFLCQYIFFSSSLSSPSSCFFPFLTCTHPPISTVCLFLYFMQIKYLISILWPLIMHNKCPIILFYWHEICSKWLCIAIQFACKTIGKFVSLLIFDTFIHIQFLVVIYIKFLMHSCMPEHIKLSVRLFFFNSCCSSLFIGFHHFHQFNYLMWQYNWFNLFDTLLCING